VKGRNERDEKFGGPYRKSLSLHETGEIDGGFWYCEMVDMIVG
jgi:hypothetical protein